jgi:hypothetical protein
LHDALPVVRSQYRQEFLASRHKFFQASGLQTFVDDMPCLIVPNAGSPY